MSCSMFLIELGEEGHNGMRTVLGMLSTRPEILPNSSNMLWMPWATGNGMQVRDNHVGVIRKGSDNIVGERGREPVKKDIGNSGKEKGGRGHP